MSPLNPILYPETYATAIDKYYNKPKYNKTSMKTITLENGQKVEISEESYNALAKAVQKEVTWNDIWADYTASKQRGFIEEVQDSVDVKIHAIKKLLITAKYLNGDWGEKSRRFYLFIDDEDNILIESFASNVISEPCYFKSFNSAERAISILGEETIKTALGDY